LLLTSSPCIKAKFLELKSIPTKDIPCSERLNCQCSGTKGAGEAWKKGRG